MNQGDRVILDAFQDRLGEVEKHVLVLNREMGEIIGKLSVLVWLIRGTLLVVIGRWLYDIVV